MPLVFKNFKVLCDCFNVDYETHKDGNTKKRVNKELHKRFDYTKDKQKYIFFGMYEEPIVDVSSPHNDKYCTLSKIVLLGRLRSNCKKHIYLIKWKLWDFLGYTNNTYNRYKNGKLSKYELINLIKKECSISVDEKEVDDALWILYKKLNEITNSLTDSVYKDGEKYDGHVLEIRNCFLVKHSSRSMNSTQNIDYAHKDYTLYSVIYSSYKRYALEKFVVKKEYELYKNNTDPAIIQDYYDCIDDLIQEETSIDINELDIENLPLLINFYTLDIKHLYKEYHVVVNADIPKDFSDHLDVCMKELNNRILKGILDRAEKRFNKKSVQSLEKMKLILTYLVSRDNAIINESIERYHQAYRLNNWSNCNDRFTPKKLNKEIQDEQ